MRDPLLKSNEAQEQEKNVVKDHSLRSDLHYSTKSLNFEANDLLNLRASGK